MTPYGRGVSRHEPFADSGAPLGRSKHKLSFRSTAPLAYISAYLSHIAYLDFNDALEEAMRRKGFRDVRFIDDPETDTQGITCRLYDVTFIAFRGSKGQRDWDNDFKFMPIRGEFSRFRVHRGFYSAWKSCEAEIVSILERHRQAVGDRRHCIVVTGHSLGAAIAVVGGRRLSDLGYPVDAVFSFGQPRVFALEPWRIISSFRIEHASRLGHFRPRVFRYTLPGDAVAAVPLRLMGYFHVGREFILQPQGVAFLSIPSVQAVSAGAHQMLRYRNALYRAGHAQAPDYDDGGEYESQVKLSAWTAASTNNIERHLPHPRAKLREWIADLYYWDNLNEDVWDEKPGYGEYFTELDRPYRYGGEKFKPKYDTFEENLLRNAVELFDALYGN